MATKVSKDGKKPTSAATNLIGESHSRLYRPAGMLVFSFLLMRRVGLQRVEVLV